MKRAFQIYLTWVLLGALCSSFIPSKLLHHHEEVHCDDLDAQHKNDACHIAIYHHGEFANKGCDHKAHISSHEEHCELCKVITTVRFELYIDQNRQHVTAFRTTSMPGDLVQLNLLANYGNFRDRAPPTC